MKKRTTAAVIFLLLLLAAFPGACADGGFNLTDILPVNDGGETVPTAPAPTTEPAPTGGSFTWDDVPVYPGSSTGLEEGWAVLLPSPNDEYARLEWRYYEVEAAIGTVADFYQTQFPALGWTQMTLMDMHVYVSGTYVKNQENDMALFWIGNPEQERTILALMRASK